ncbi:MAG TPA: pilus assembly protein [Paracoccaceae bacterium]|nr:pilus assembly protein [Paracoccaceae bacterium]
MTTRPSVLARLRRSLRRFGRREDGGAMVELVIVMPVMMMIFMAAFESGLYMTRQIMLERAVDQTIRELRLGRLENLTHEMLKDEICDRAQFLLACDGTIRIELRPVSTTTWNLPADPTTCFDRDEVVNPSLTPNPGVENQLMLVRVCVIQDAVFPGANIASAIVRDTQGGYALVSVAAFVNEP